MSATTSPAPGAAPGGNPGSAANPAGASPATGPEPERIGRLEPAALRGVLVREIINFSSYWKGSTFSSVMEPTIYLLAFGFGFGALVSEVGGMPYIEFIGTGTVATAVLFSTAMPSMFGTAIKAKFQRTYDAILAAPVDVEELVTAEALWMAMRAAVFGCAPLIVALFFGLDPSWGMLLVPAINFIAGYGWSCFGITVAGRVDTIENFSYITSGFITPVMLTAGTFFPLDTLPQWAQILGWLNPLFHTVELVRHAAFGWEGLVDLAHLGFLLGFALILWRMAIAGMHKKLVI